MNEGILLPETFINIDNIQVDSYFPMELKTDGTSLVIALLMICYKNNPYRFEYMAIRKTPIDVFSEPIHYGVKDNLVLKDICQDILKRFNGSFGSIYIQMTDNQTGQKIGISFWQEPAQERSFSIVYHTEVENGTKLHGFINQVYTAFLIQQEKLMQKLELPDEQIA